jgi:hypothetical protein
MNYGILSHKDYYVQSDTNIICIILLIYNDDEYQAILKRPDEIFDAQPGKQEFIKDNK